MNGAVTYTLCSVSSTGSRTGELKGNYGCAVLPTVDDYYATHPFGDKSPSPPHPPHSTQRGFYDQEFAPLQLDDGELTSAFKFIPRSTVPVLSTYISLSLSL